MNTFLKNQPPSPPPNTDSSYRDYFEHLASVIKVRKEKHDENDGFNNDSNKNNSLKSEKLAKSDIFNDDHSQEDHSISSNLTRKFDNPGQAILSIYSNHQQSGPRSHTTEMNLVFDQNLKNQSESSLNTRKLELMVGRQKRIIFDDIEMEHENGDQIIQQMDNNNIFNTALEDYTKYSDFKKKSVNTDNKYNHQYNEILDEMIKLDQAGNENSSREYYNSYNSSQNLDDLHLKQITMAKRVALDRQQ